MFPAESFKAIDKSGEDCAIFSDNGHADSEDGQHLLAFGRGRHPHLVRISGRSVQ